MDKKQTNNMRNIRIEKMTINIGAGEAGPKLEKSQKLIETLFEHKAVKTKTKKRIPSWGVRPGLTIGVKTTLRGKNADKYLKRLLKAVGNKLKESNFDNNGNVNFSIKEYIDIPDVKYMPDVGIIGFNVCITLERPGYRVKKRARKKSRIGRNHLITKKEAIDFMKKEYGVEIL